MSARRWAPAVAALIVVAACGDASVPTVTAAPPLVSTTTTAPAPPTGPPPTTTAVPPPTTVPGSTTTVPAFDWAAVDAASWLVHGLDGIRTNDGTLVWATEPVLGPDNLARDRDGGFVWVDAAGLWWVARGATRPTLVLPGGADELADVVDTPDGPVARLGIGEPTWIDLASGAEVAAPEAVNVDFGEGGRATWIAVNGISAVVIPPDVVLDAEGQPRDIAAPARLVLSQDGTPLLDLEVGGFYEPWVRLHDFDGQHLILSRGPFEPALPEETFILVDIACADCGLVWAAAASHAVLPRNDLASPDRLERPAARILTATPIGTDEGVTALGDGTYVVFPEAATATEATLTVDLAVWFGGAEANTAARVDGETEVPVPNDYYIRNRDPRTLTLRVADNVVVTSVWFDYDTDPDLESDPIGYADFLTAMRSTDEGAWSNLRVDPWWITVRDGQIVELHEQYVP